MLFSTRVPVREDASPHPGSMVQICRFDSYSPHSADEYGFAVARYL